jgi:hypothetical protein
MMKKLVMALGIFTLLLSGAAFGQAPQEEKKEEKKESPSPQSELKVEQAVIAKDVKDREPVEPGETFSKDAGRVFCFVKLSGGKPDTEIKMVWTRADAKTRTVITLPVQAGRWRTWSSKKIDAGSVGDWKVEIKDANDNLLTTVNFKVE